MALYGDEKRKYQREWIAARRNKWIEDNGGECVVCKSTESLEVDHINRDEKQYQPREIWTRRQEVRDAELSKCQILCKKCHKEKTVKELTKDVVHGSYGSGYRKNCKCDECKASVAPYWREYRKAKSRRGAANTTK